MIIATRRIVKGLFILLLAISALALIGGQTSVSGQEPSFPDYQVKATFLFQFSQFVDWPPEVFGGPEAPLVIGILGQDPFGSYLDETVRNEKVYDHPVAVRRYSRLEEITNCQVLFVSRAEAGRLREIVAGLKGRNILTVSDADRFADRGGMIQFVTRNNRVRLIVNLAAARTARLTISSKLLRPATVINPGAN